MDMTMMWGAMQTMLKCLAEQYPQLKTIGAGLLQVVGGASALFAVSQSKMGGYLNALLPPVLSNVMTSLGGLLNKVALNPKK